MFEASEGCSLSIGFPPSLPQDRVRILAIASYGCQNSACCSVRAQLIALLPHILVTPALPRHVCCVIVMAAAAAAPGCKAGQQLSQEHTQQNM